MLATKANSHRRLASKLLMQLMLSLLGMGVAPVAKGDSKGIPYTEKFQLASYPYARVVPGCTDWRRPDRLGDAWGAVSFAGACAQHDRCYHSLDASWGECNELYQKSLRASCDRDLERARLEKGSGGKPDAQAKELCYAIADMYFVKVHSTEAARRFEFDQRQESAYLDYVASVVNDVYRSVLRRDGTAKEKSRALAALSKDYSLDDLKAALMGQRIDQDNVGDKLESSAALPVIDEASVPELSPP